MNSADLPYINGRDIYECANQLEGYVDPGTPERLAQFLLREGKAAADLADEIVRLRAWKAKAMEVLRPFHDYAKDPDLFPVGSDYEAARLLVEKEEGRD